MATKNTNAAAPLAADAGAAGKKFGVVVTATAATAAAAAGDDLGKLYFPSDDTSAVYIGKQRYGLSEGARDYLQKKLQEENAAKVTVTATVTPSGIQDRKDATAYTVTVLTKFDGKLTDAAAVPEMDRGGQGVTLTKSPGAAGTYTATVNVAANAERGAIGFTATVQGVEKKAVASFPRYYPVRTAAVADAAPTLAVIRAATKTAPKASSLGKYTFTSASAYYMYLFVPDGVTAPADKENSVEASEGPLPVYFKKLADFDVESGAEDIGAGFKYKVYRSEQQQAANTSHEVTFK